MSTVHRFPPEGFAGAGGCPPGERSGEAWPPEDTPESYLRRFAEAQLRRLAAGETTAADCASRVDAVAAAFEGTAVLEGEQAEAVADDLDVALAARSPERGTLLHAGRRAQVSALRGTAGFARIFARTAQMRARGMGEGGGDPEDPSEDVSVIPAGAVLRLRDDADEDIYLLSYVTTPGRAWLSVAARTAEPRLPRRHASPPSERNAGPQRYVHKVPPEGTTSPNPPGTMGTPGGTRRRDTFAAGGLTAVDDAGRKYELYFSGGGGHWYLGRLTVSPTPPPGIAWLEVRCAGQSVRLDLTAAAPDADVTVRPVAGSAGEGYLLQRAEALLGHAAAAGGTAGIAGLVVAEMTGLASAVPALRAVGVLPGDSPVPGQLAALAERMGAPGPGRLIAEPGKLPERWAGVLDASGSGALRAADARSGGAGSTDADTIAAAHLTAVLPEADGLAVHLAGMVTLPDEGTLIFGGLRAWSTDGGQSLWLRDGSGAWHAVSITGWSSNGSSYTFQAGVVPPVGPDVSHVEFYATGATTQVRAVIPLTWWTPRVRESGGCPPGKHCRGVVPPGGDRNP
ncbi:MAG TPA: hypothetical protein VF060_24660 [Trebonia sp.]